MHLSVKLRRKVHNWPILFPGDSRPNFLKLIGVSIVLGLLLGNCLARGGEGLAGTILHRYIIFKFEHAGGGEVAKYRVFRND